MSGTRVRAFDSNHARSNWMYPGHDVQPRNTTRSLMPSKVASLVNILMVVLVVACSTEIAEAITMTSSAVGDSDVCPGDTVVFTCVTHTGQLQWISDDGISKWYRFPSEVNEPAFTKSGSAFELKLVNTSNNVFESTATAHNVTLNNDGVNILCTSDISNPEGQNTSETDSINIASPPSAPLSLNFSSTLSFVTISWAAPLDTPLCVHSYTVNISNASQVMVYNTTDTSLNITGLTPGNEYSVTVAGRDGAGRLGQGSNMQLPMPEAIADAILTSSIDPSSKSSSSVVEASSCVLPVQTSTPCECPSGQQAIPGWVWIAIAVPWIILVVVIPAVLVYCIFKASRPRIRKQDLFMNDSDTPRMKYQVSTARLEDLPPPPSLPTTVTYDDVTNNRHIMEGLTAVLPIDGRIYDEVRECSNGSPPIHMKTNTSYKCRTANGTRK